MCLDQMWNNLALRTAQLKHTDASFTEIKVFFFFTLTTHELKFYMFLDEFYLACL